MMILLNTNVKTMLHLIVIIAKYSYDRHFVTNKGVKIVMCSLFHIMTQLSYKRLIFKLCQILNHIGSFLNTWMFNLDFDFETNCG